MIYVFTSKKSKEIHSKWAFNFFKVRGVVDDFTELIELILNPKSTSDKSTSFLLPKTRDVDIFRDKESIYEIWVYSQREDLL